MDILTIDLVKDLHHLIKKSLDEKTKVPKAIKNLTQMQILYYLTNNKDKVVYQKDIGEAIKLRKSSITEQLDYLEEVGIIERIQDKEDKRRNSIKLSKEALQKENEIEDTLKKLNDKATNGIDKNDLELFEKIIKKMEDNLK